MHNLLFLVLVKFFWWGIVPLFGARGGYIFVLYFLYWFTYISYARGRMVRFTVVPFGNNKSRLNCAKRKKIVRGNLWLFFYSLSPQPPLGQRGRKKSTRVRSGFLLCGNGGFFYESSSAAWAGFDLETGEVNDLKIWFLLAIYFLVGMANMVSPNRDFAAELAGATHICNKINCLKID